jgi:hypothetical protein
MERSRIARSFYKKFQRRLCAMQVNMKFNSTFSGRLRAMQHSVESTPRYAAYRRVDTYLRISPRNQNQIQKYFTMIISDLGRIGSGKNWGAKILWDCYFKDPHLFTGLEPEPQRKLCIFWPNISLEKEPGPHHFSFRILSLAASKWFILLDSLFFSDHPNVSVNYSIVIFLLLSQIMCYLKQTKKQVV